MVPAAAHSLRRSAEFYAGEGQSKSKNPIFFDFLWIRMEVSGCEAGRDDCCNSTNNATTVGLVQNAVGGWGTGKFVPVEGLSRRKYAHSSWSWTVTSARSLKKGGGEAASRQPRCRWNGHGTTVDPVVSRTIGCDKRNQLRNSRSRP